MRARLREFEARSVGERKRVRDNAARWRAMTAEERDRMRRQMQRLKELPLEERQRLLDEVLPETLEGVE